MSAVAVSSALDQALALFEPENRPAEVRLRDGYLDLLGEGGIDTPHLSHRVVQSRLLPPLYERVVHPLSLRIAAGREAPNRHEEQRIGLETMKISSGDRVLDIGCGPGNFTRSYAAAAGDGLVVGLDSSPVMLASAVRRTPGSNVAYILGDGCALPFVASSYDAVSCFGAIHLFDRPLEALREMMRVLAPGGRIGLLTTCERGAKGESSDVAKRKYGGWRMFARDELTGAFESQGMVDVEQRVMHSVQIVSARKPTA
ncbi:MAG: methyltransferase domain-containing protein [Solirubrobacteraceae bacterium]